MTDYSVLRWMWAVLVLAVMLTSCFRGEPENGSKDGATHGGSTEGVQVLGAAHGVEFGRINGVGLGERGFVAVLDGLNHRVHTFSTEAQATWGRAGSGPSELRRPAGIAVDYSRRIWVADVGNARFQIISRDREVIGTHRRTAPVGFPVPWRALPSRNVALYEALPWLDPRTRGEGPVFLGMDLASGVVAVDTIRRFPPVRPPAWTVLAGADREGVVQAGRVEVPFSVRSHDLVDADGAYWYGRTDEPRWTRVSAVGDTVEIHLAQLLPPSAAPRELRVQVFDSLEARFGDGLQADLSDVPDRLPLWDTFLVDDRGCLWIKPFSPPGSEDPRSAEWLVVAPDGSLEGSLPLPFVAEPPPAVRDGWAAGVIRNTMGVEDAGRVHIRDLNADLAKCAG
jgi:hypothetical protein